MKCGKVERRSKKTEMPKKGAATQLQMFLLLQTGLAKLELVARVPFRSHDGFQKTIVVLEGSVGKSRRLGGRNPHHHKRKRSVNA
jgi:hypothetical protein